MTNPADYPLDLDYFTWRKPVTVDGEPRLLIPCSDPMLYEYPADAIFTDCDDAMEYRDDVWEDEDTSEWVLVRYVGSIVPGT